MPSLPLQDFLDTAGLNRQHVFDLSALPADLLAPLAPAPHERQLILFGHAGRRLWECVQAEGIHGAHPIDAYSMRTVEKWLGRALPSAHARFVFPQGLASGRHLGLQKLGMLAGWHHAAPFMVGVDAYWGSWFAYRAAILTDTALPPSEPEDLGHPCPACIDKPCITACPGKALEAGSLSDLSDRHEPRGKTRPDPFVFDAHSGPMQGENGRIWAVSPAGAVDQPQVRQAAKAFDMDACHRQRLSDNSPCALGCLARQACPVGAEHRYEDSQIRHSAAGSLAVIRQYHSGKAAT